MADIYRSEQAKRLYGFIAAGGTAGGLAGPAITYGLAEAIGVVTLIVVAALLLEAAVLCATRLEPRQEAAREARVGGGAFDGLGMVLRSPYITGILLWVALLSIAATFLYFEQAQIVADTSSDPAVRTRIFATVDLAVGVLTLALQFVATGKLIQRFGVGPALSLLPLVFVGGVVVRRPIAGVIVVVGLLS